MTIAQQLGRISATAEMNTKAREFCNLAKLVAMSRGEHVNMRHIVRNDISNRARIALGPTVKSIVEGSFRVYSMNDQQKAAALAGGTASGDWTEQLAAYDTLAAAFLELLRNWGAFDAMLPSMRRVPFRTRIGASTTGITATTVAQQAPKPISRLTLTTTQIDEIKVAATLVVTDELMKFGSSAAGNLFATELSNAVAVQTDSAFVSILTSGATSVPSGGGTAEHVRNDLRAMLANVTTSARSQLFLLTTSATAKVFAVLHDNSGGGAFPTMGVNGGTIGGIQVVVSDGVLASTALLVDAQQVAAASETIQLSASNEALVQLNDAPELASDFEHVPGQSLANEYDGLESREIFRRAEAHDHRRLRSHRHHLCRRLTRTITDGRRHHHLLERRGRMDQADRPQRVGDDPRSQRSHLPLSAGRQLWRARTRRGRYLHAGERWSSQPGSGGSSRERGGVMNLPTQAQVDAAKRLGISLNFHDAPLTIARLVELIEDLQRRVAELEQQRTGASSSWSLRRTK